ncbi:MAG: histidine--tRNA ligase [Oscillospiraceae bacterium]|jgi:histidyl-tRNA synthetase|nr:histidine--tRNA ligase [Oscillospiraceae bacterium]
MALITKAVRGTRDVLPHESQALRYIERTALELAQAYGYAELRTPVFEHTELFERGMGDTTDVVQKEMYTFFDKGGRSVTLRPEGTAGAARACLEHGLLAEALPCKVSYVLRCYRYEKPQAGRYREFSQFGVECFGAATPAADAELIALAAETLATLSVTDTRVEINSIGCPECRKRYLDALRAHFAQRQSELCETCQGRLEKNPMRILDCKSPVCAGIATEAPTVLEYICDACAEHFDGVKRYLDAIALPYEINPRIVRGLDYYTRTVFEILSEFPEAKGLVLAGGGRYDGLVEELGGQHTPSLGFGMGIERVWLQMQALQAPLPEKHLCELYIAAMNSDALQRAAQLAQELRASGWHVEYDIVGRSLKAQMKYADKIHAKNTVVLGEDELKNQRAKLKDMKTGAEELMTLPDFADEFERLMLRRVERDILEGFGDDVTPFPQP